MSRWPRLAVVMRPRVLGLLVMALAAVAFAGSGAPWLSARSPFAHRDTVDHQALGDYESWTFHAPRQMTTVREAYAYLTEQLGLTREECALRTIAVQTAWQARLAAEEIVFSLDPCRGKRYYLAVFTNRDRRLFIAAVPSRKGQWPAALNATEVKVDVTDALAIAGERAGRDMLSAMRKETQVSLFLSRNGRVPLWEVRYDAWRNGHPLRYLVVTIDARTGQVTGTSG